MLPDRELQLLTASVDGALSGRQRRQLERLLRHSPEARLLHRDLQQDSSQLRGLPRPIQPRDISGPVLQTIVEKGLVPARPRQAPVRAGVSAWKGLMAAAAVLLVLGFASYSYFANSVPVDPGITHPGNQAASHPTPGPNPPGQVALDRSNPPVPSVPRGPTPPRPGGQNPPQHPDPTPVDPEPEPIGAPKSQEKPKSEPDPRESARPVLTARGVELFRIEVAQLALPMILPLGELEQEGARQKLLTELGKNQAFRLELPVHDSVKGVERLQAACKATGIKLMVEHLAQARLKTSTWKTHYAFYLETLTPTELTRLLQQLAQIEKQAGAKKPPESVLDRLVVTRISPTDEPRELGDLLGTPLPPQSPAEQGGAKSKGPEQPGLVVSLPPYQPSRNSAEVKRFLDSRKPAKPDAVRVLIVVRRVG